MSDPIEYGIWLSHLDMPDLSGWSSDIGILFHTSSLFVAQAELNRRSNPFGSRKASIMTFGPGGKPVGLKIAPERIDVDEDQMLALLRRCEWVQDSDDGDGTWCPICGMEIHHGHGKSCELAALLREVGSE
jgi:hypothetical protein